MSALVAGFGNIFLSDDGLGAAVIRLLAQVDLGGDVRVRDFGTGGMHLALEMLNGYDRVILVDAVSRDDPPGTVFAIDCTQDDVSSGTPPDAHAMTIDAALSLYRTLRDRSGAARKPQIIVVGCVPQSLAEGMELSEPVRAALPACVDLVSKLTHVPIGRGAATS